MDSQPANSQQPAAKSPSLKEKIREFYDKQYFMLMLIPIIMVILAAGFVSYKYFTTGDLFNKDISLKGGVTLTVPLEKPVDIKKFSASLENELKGRQINVRDLSSGIRQVGVIIEADIDGNNKQEVDNFISSVEKSLGFNIKEKYSLEFFGSALGSRFFRETMWALLLAFIAMAVTVIIYFRQAIPSLAVIAAAFGDIVITLAIVNIIGMRIGTAGIAAFLMLIGYSVDTDMLLTTRVLKRKEGTVFDRVLDSVKTGMKMTLTTIFAVIVGLIFITSSTIKEIMIIILIGLIIDMLTTWFMNVGILRIYVERKSGKTKTQA